jgi:hypothetical protein
VVFKLIFTISFPLAARLPAALLHELRNVLRWHIKDGAQAILGQSHPLDLFHQIFRQAAPQE